MILTGRWGKVNRRKGDRTSARRCGYADRSRAKKS